VRRALWKLITGDIGLGGETGFEFSYVPMLGKGTKAEKVMDTGKRGTMGKRGVKILSIFLLVAGVLGVALGWGLVWAAEALWGVVYWYGCYGKGLRILHE